MITIEQVRNKKAFICDMDGVIYHSNMLLPGAKNFIDWLKKEKKAFLFLTNSSERSPKELQQKLFRLGVDVEARHFYTSALATAAFLSAQLPNGTAYVIGEAGLINAIYEEGYSMNDVNPDYVVVGESRTYTFENLTKAVNLVAKGAKLIGTNPDLTGPIEGGIVPATGSLIAPIEMSTGSKAYFVGKPNPLMMRNALKKLECHHGDTVIIGDRMDTDMIAGIESDIDTVLVLTGVSTKENIKQFAYQPGLILNGVSEIISDSITEKNL